MEKNFNDQELSDIMKEIEALEEDLTGSETKSIEMSSPVLEELAQMEQPTSFSGESEEEDVHTEMCEVTELPKAMMPEARVPSHSHSSSPLASSSIKFHVQGELKLDLEFNISGKMVTLSVSEEELSILMEGGMKFSLPIHDQRPLKKVS